jgi:hypothetical protein
MQRFNTQSWLVALLIALTCMIAASFGATHAARALTQRRTSITTTVTDRLLVQQQGNTIGEYAYTIALPTAWRDLYRRIDQTLLVSPETQVLPVEYMLVEPGHDPAPLFSLVAVPVTTWNDAEARGHYHGTAIAIRDGLVFAYVLPSQRHDVRYSTTYKRMIDDLPRVLSNIRFH